VQPRLSIVLTSIGVLAVLGLSGGACSGSNSDTTGAPPVVAPEVVSPPEPTAEVDPAPARQPEPSPEPTPPAPPAVAEHLELTFVGDVIFGRYRPSGFDPIPEGGHDPFEEIRAQIESDLLVGNLETPLVESLPDKSPIGSRFAFGASREQAQLLVGAGFDALSLANNHWYDQREEGLRQSPKILEDLGIVPLGRAREEDPLFRVETVERNGWRVGFLAVTTRSNAPQRETGPRLPFLSTRDMISTLAPLVEAARADHDLIAVVVHWGEEYADAPALVQMRAARGLVDAGADLVIGHHPHVLQGIEKYGGGLIAYSLGNFVFENTNDPPRLTGVLRIRAGRDSKCMERVVFHPAYVKRTPIQHPVPATGFMHTKVVDRLTALGKPLGSEWTPDGDDLVLVAPPCRSPAAEPAPAPDR
jgi:poly-gamma-glutamate synthesis protein (capsule biosynthesis protein)